MTTPGEKSDEREVHTFTVPGLFLPPLAGAGASTKTARMVPREIPIYRPNERQMTGLLRLIEAIERGGDPVRQILQFERLVCSLFVEAEDWKEFEDVNIEGKVTWAEYGDFVQEVIRYFYPAARQAGPAEPATRRRAGRAR